MVKAQRYTVIKTKLHVNLYFMIGMHKRPLWLAGSACEAQLRKCSQCPRWFGWLRHSKVNDREKVSKLHPEKSWCCDCHLPQFRCSESFHLHDVVSRSDISDVYPLAVDIVAVSVPATHWNALISVIVTWKALLKSWRKKTVMCSCTSKPMEACFLPLNKKLKR